VAVTQQPNVVAFVGGVGGAKLAHGLAQVLPPERLTVVVNTGDDFWHYGLRICPDLDTVMYTLAGWVDPVNGWGVRGDSTAMLDALRRYQETPWFRLGDQDLATHLLRTQALHAGERLTTITARLAKKAGISPLVLPMADAPVSTMIETVEYGELEFQEYFVKYHWQPTVTALRYAGAEAASVPPEVGAALAAADVIAFAPSNPYLSIAPILAVPGMREQIAARDVPRVALSPIVQGGALKGPAAKLMAELKQAVSPVTVAEFYGTVITHFVYDQRDGDLPIPTRQALRLDTVMKTESDRATLAAKLLTEIALSC